MVTLMTEGGTELEVNQLNEEIINEIDILINKINARETKTSNQRR